MKSTRRAAYTVATFQNAHSDEARILRIINGVADELKAIGISLCRFGYAFHVGSNGVVVTLGETRQDADVARALFARRQHRVRLSDSQRAEAENADEVELALEQAEARPASP